jgi:hypothetical protein
MSHLEVHFSRTTLASSACLFCDLLNGLHFPSFSNNPDFQSENANFWWISNKSWSLDISNKSVSLIFFSYLCCWAATNFLRQPPSV